MEPACFLKKGEALCAADAMLHALQQEFTVRAGVSGCFYWRLVGSAGPTSHRDNIQPSHPIGENGIWEISRYVVVRARQVESGN